MKSWLLGKPASSNGLPLRTHENQRYIGAVRGVALSPCCRVVEPNPTAMRVPDDRKIPRFAPVR